MTTTMAALAMALVVLVAWAMAMALAMALVASVAWVMAMVHAMAIGASAAWAMATVPVTALGAMVAMATSVLLSMADTSPQDFTENMAICKSVCFPESITKVDFPHPAGLYT